MIETRLRGCLKPDAHTTTEGTYLVRSIYFDDFNDSFLRETINGTEPRYKWRIRAYNGSDKRIILEKKTKIYGMISKESLLLDKNDFVKNG